MTAMVIQSAGRHRLPGRPPMELLADHAAPKGKFWMRMGTNLLPFADAASAELPLKRLFRLSLFQITVGMAAVMLIGTLNRVMIVELHVQSWLVAMMVSLPLVFAPLRALIGHKSDNHRSILGWKRVPYIWFGTLLQFGGFAIMPFALLIMSGDTTGSPTVGLIGAGLAFLMVGAGMHTVQTAGLALATDLAPEALRPRVVALMYVMLLVGMLISGLVIGALLHHFSALKLVKVVQGAGALTMVVNLFALWKQEARNPAATRVDSVGEAQSFRAAWAELIAVPRTVRLLVAVGLGAAAFNMQDVLLEPYGGEVLGMTVGATTSLTALWALGTLIGLGLAARLLGRNYDPNRLAGYRRRSRADRLCRGRAGRSARLAGTARSRRRRRRFRRWAVRGRHADRGDGAVVRAEDRRRPVRSGDRRVGRGPGVVRRACYRRCGRRPRRRRRRCGAGRPRLGADWPGECVQHALLSRNRPVVCHACGDRPAGAAVAYRRK